jgi:signal transduction histidine kinase
MLAILSGLTVAGFAAGALLGWMLAERRLRAMRKEQVRLRHDLRNALAPALLVAERLAGHPLPEIKKHADTLDRTVTRLLALLNSKLTG